MAMIKLGLISLFGVCGAIAWACSATDDVVAHGAAGADSGLGGSGGGASGGGGSAGGGFDAGLDVVIGSDAPVGETCEAAAHAQSTYGCEYYAVQVDTIDDPNGGYGLPGACYAMFVANRGIAPVKINVERGGVAFTNTDFIRIPNGQGAAITYDAYDANAG